MTEKKYLNAWMCTYRMTSDRLRSLLSGFGSFEKAWNTVTIASLTTCKIKQEVAEEIMNKIKTINPDDEWSKLEKLNIKISCMGDDDYPASLKEISAPPYLLYIRGEILASDALAVSIVGSRTPSTYGKQTCRDFASSLAKSHITIISGLATGCDAIAHEGALSVSGRTIAVLGHGLERIYPSTNTQLAEKILSSGGAIVSEYPIGHDIYPQNFPARNRIVSGLSRGVLIVEAKESSGSLITAKFALEQNRDIFAIPGSVFNTHSVGTNNLIKRSEAAMVCIADDILEILNIDSKYLSDNDKKILPQNEIEKKIYDFMTKDPIHVDDISRGTDLSSAAISSTLTVMFLRGMVQDMGAGTWAKI